MTFHLETWLYSHIRPYVGKERRKDFVMTSALDKHKIRKPEQFSLEGKAFKFIQPFHSEEVKTEKHLYSVAQT